MIAITIIIIIIKTIYLLMASHNRNQKKMTAAGETVASLEMELEAAVDIITTRTRLEDNVA